MPITVETANAWLDQLNTRYRLKPQYRISQRGITRIQYAVSFQNFFNGDPIGSPSLEGIYGELREAVMAAARHAGRMIGDVTLTDEALAFLEGQA